MNQQSNESATEITRNVSTGLHPHSAAVETDAQWSEDRGTQGSSPRIWKLAAICMTVVTTVSLATAGYFAGVSSTRSASEPLAINPFPFPSTIDAVASATSEKYSIATGIVSDEAEGFFVLDHNSGILQCSVFYPRVGQFMATFTGNAGELVGAGGKGGEYIMVTGQADMTRGGRSAALAPTLVYVLHTGSGNYGVFAVPFDRQAVAAGRPQQGVLLPMGTGTASVVPTR